jgi:hypothetical protein
LKGSYLQEGHLDVLQYLVREKEGDLNARAQDGKLAHQQYLVREKEGDLNARAEDGISWLSCSI